jgi:hypothetical protein
MVPPPGFTVQVVTSVDQESDRHATVICLDVDSLGSIDTALTWVSRYPQKGLFVAAGQVGGDMTPLSEHIRAVLAPPEDRSQESWRRAVYVLWFAIEHPEFATDDDGSEGGVIREEFDEHLRAYRYGEHDDGSTC